MNLNLGYDRCGRFSDIIHKIGLDYIEYKDNMFIKNEDVSKIYEYRKLCHEHLTSYFENDVINLAKEFLENNSIYEFEVSDDYFGLFYKDELIYVVSLKNKQYIVQECVKLNTFVENGLIKLIDFIIAKNNTPIFIEIDRRLQNVEFYKSCGFEKVSESEPNYFYVFGYNREKEISKLAENYRFSEEETRRIYDCGYIKMKFSK